MKKPLIKLSHLVYHYKEMQFIFSLTVNAGDIIAILGPSGAGKSTLLNLIAGFISPNAGELCLAGRNATQLSPQERPISMLFQENNIFEHLTVERNIALGFTKKIILNQEDKNRIQAISDEMGISHLLLRLPPELSGGQRQRVALARCLIQRRPILLLDEPFSSLDPALRNEMLQLVKRICAQYSLTLLMVSHNLEDAQKIAPRSVVIDNGSILFDGETTQLLSGQHPAATALGITLPTSNLPPLQLG